MLRMEFRNWVFLCTLFCGLQDVSLRSIDQIIADSDRPIPKPSNLRDDDTDVHGSHSQSIVPFDYVMEGRKEELVKVQLDLIMTKDHWNKVIYSKDAPRWRKKRNAVKDQMNLWPRRVPYEINERFSIEDRLKLIMAMDHWEEFTCLKFVEARSYDFDYIEFAPDRSKCESLLGRMKGRQKINLAPKCMEKAVILHEIGHALGLYHEHMRADRDDYVTVHYENVWEQYHNQFDKLKQDHYNNYSKPYDYESIMHYGKLYYARDSFRYPPSIEPKNASYLDVIGNALSLSFYDVNIVSDMYECSRGCVPKACPRNGFLGKNCECYCTGKNSYDIVLCNEEKCGNPEINLYDYIVSTVDYVVEIDTWKEDMSYVNGTTFNVEHRDESCGLRIGVFSCTDGQWEGKVPPCEKACVVEYYDDKYVVKKESGRIAVPRDMVPSLAGLDVSCKYTRGNDVIKYITCSDGEWLDHINDIKCKERSLCSSIMNAQLHGTQEQGYTITCSQGYELVTKGWQGNKIRCSWEGRWEPATPVCKPERSFCSTIMNAQLHGTQEQGFTVTCSQGYELVTKGWQENKIRCSWEGRWEPASPVCKPANCTIPANSVAKYYQKNDELFIGSDVSHGSDVTLKCARGYIPVQVTMSCSYGKWKAANGILPRCKIAECPVPTVIDTKGYWPRKAKYRIGEIVRVGNCKENLALKGGRRLECLKTGMWSDMAICQPFCSHGEEDFKKIKNKAFKSDVRKHRYLRIASYIGCQRACENYKRFLCLTFVYGRENWQHHCLLYRQSAEKRSNKMENKALWTTGVRTCVRKNKRK